MIDYRKVTDEFFYDNFSRAWKGTIPERMVPVYMREMQAMLDYLECGEGYIQEYARDYPLAHQLTIEVDGELKSVQKPDSPYTIIPSKGIVVFQKNREIVYQCSYRKYFQILEYYINQLVTRFPLKMNEIKWKKQLESLKKVRFRTYIEKITDKLKFWDNTPGNPHTSYEGAKAIDLYPGDIASFRQLNCKDTLRYLTVNGLTKVKDLEVLSEYTKLGTLYLRQMNIKDIGFIASLVNLNELGLAGNQITDLSPLASLKKLTHLYIADNPITDFSVMEELPNLRTLYTDIDQLPDQLAWDTIPNRIALRVLFLTPLENCYYHAEQIYSRKVSCLVEQAGGKQNLAKQPDTLIIKDKWLYSGLMNTLGSEPVKKSELTRIKSLNCANGIKLCEDFAFLTEIGDYSCLKAAIKLQALNLADRVVNDFSWLRKCMNIRTLNLSHTDFAELSLLSEMRQLRELYLTGCKNLKEEDFYVLRDMKKLRELDLSDTAFCDLTLLQGMKHLQGLYLNGCEHLSGMENMVYDLVNIDRYSFSEKELCHFHAAIINAFCNIAEDKGYRICKGGTGLLPVEIANIQQCIPDLWQTFLTQIDSCVKEDGKVWFLTESSYHMYPDMIYPWEQMSELEYIYKETQNSYDLDNNGFYDKKYKQKCFYEIWKVYLPIIVSREGDVITYYAVNIEDNKVVFWNNTNRADMVSTKKTLPQFLLQINHFI